MKHIKIVSIKATFLLFVLLAIVSFSGVTSSNAEAATPAQFRKACSNYNSAIKKAEKLKVNVKAAKKSYTQLCNTPTVTTPSESEKNLKKIKDGAVAINKKAQKAKEYKDECKTAADKAKDRCKTLAAAAGITAGGTPSSAGTGISKCGNVDTAFNYGCAGADSGSGGNKNPIFQVLFFIVNILAIGVGMVAIGGVIYGAILYTTASDNGEQTKKGVTIVVNAVLGVILFAFMYAILNFLVPGGLFT